MEEGRVCALDSSSFPPGGKAGAMQGPASIDTLRHLQLDNEQESEFNNVLTMALEGGSCRERCQRRLRRRVKRLRHLRSLMIAQFLNFHCNRSRLLYGRNISSILRKFLIGSL